MNRKMVKVIGTFLCTFLLLASHLSRAKAEEPGFLKGESAWEVASSNDRGFSVRMDQPLFSGKDLMPGDEAANAISIHNDSSQRVRVYLKAVCDYEAFGDGAVNGEGNLVSVDGKTFHHGLLDMIEMTVLSGNTVIFTGTASGKTLGGLDSQLIMPEGIQACDVPSKASGQLTVWIKLPGKKVGNEYMDALGALDWKLSIKGIDGPGGGSTPGGGTNPGGGGTNPGGGTVPGGDSTLGGGGSTQGGGNETERDTIGVYNNSKSVESTGSAGSPRSESRVNLDIQDVPPLDALAKTGGAIFHVKELGRLLALLLLCLALVNRKRKERRSGKRNE